jgi:all-trans-retinol dehydrogenase (NAD+)
MENIFDVGVKPYRAAAPHNGQSIVDIVKLVIELVIDFVMFVVLSVPVYLKLLKDLVTPVQQKEIAGQLGLVTGGANGLGRAICLQLAKEGCNVAVVDLDEVNAAKTAEDCAKFNVKAKAYKADVSVFSAVKELSKSVEADIGPVDILVNNAAVLPLVSLREGTEHDLDRIIDVNFKSHIWVSLAPPSRHCYIINRTLAYSRKLAR